MVPSAQTYHVGEGKTMRIKEKYSDCENGRIDSAVTSHNYS